MKVSFLIQTANLYIHGMAGGRKNKRDKGLRADKRLGVLDEYNGICIIWKLEVQKLREVPEYQSKEEEEGRRVALSAWPVKIDHERAKYTGYTTLSAWE